MFAALTIAAVAVTTPADSACARAAYMLFNRHLNSTWIDSAGRLLAAIRSTEPRHERCLYLWSRFHTTRGDEARTDKDKLAFYSRAKAIAETLIQVNDANPDGHMWWGVAQGRIGQVRGVLNSLFMVPGIKRAFNRTLELDSGYAAAWDALGVLYYELPGFAGGSLTLSEQYLRRGVAADPNYAVIRLDLAKVLIRQKRWAEARAELQKLLAIKHPTYPADYVNDDRPEAEKLLEQIKTK
ncbi:MAG: tetratricopeptide repeat protein [candidate division WOR-3 bacterium]